MGTKSFLHDFASISVNLMSAFMSSSPLRREIKLLNGSSSSPKGVPIQFKF